MQPVKKPEGPQAHRPAPPPPHVLVYTSVDGGSTVLVSFGPVPGRNEAPAALLAVDCFGSVLASRDSPHPAAG